MPNCVVLDLWAAGFITMITQYYLSSDLPVAFLPGSGLETTLSQHHNGVMTYSRYINGSILSVPKVVVDHKRQTEDEFFQTVHGLVKSFLG